MSEEELMQAIKEIRTSRRTPKTTAVAKPKTSSKTIKPISNDALFASMSPEQIESLIKQLEAKK
jgi:hypothetical protein